MISIKSPTLRPGLRVLYRVSLLTFAALLATSMLRGWQTNEMNSFYSLWIFSVHGAMCLVIGIVSSMQNRTNGQPPKPLLEVSAELLGATKIPALLAVIAVTAVFFYTKQFVW